MSKRVHNRMQYPLFDGCDSLLKYDVIVLALFFSCVSDKPSFCFEFSEMSVAVRLVAALVPTPLESSLCEVIGPSAIAFRSSACKFVSDELELTVRLFLKTLQKSEII